MGRIRTIKPEFFLHEGLFDLEQESQLPVRLAFAGLWCQCDREGRFKWQPRKLKVTILPYDEIDFARVLDALTTRGFVQKYTVDSVEYGHIPSFSDHQVVNNRERASVYPDPSNDKGLTREQRDEHASSTRASINLQEGKGREQVNPASKSESGYVFEGQTIKLKRDDYEKCIAQYPHLDIDEQLSQLDLELQGKRKWFMEMHSKLNYRNKTPTHQRSYYGAEEHVI
ncbi:MAG: hypothetical protein KDI17_07135 [Halioglobus sp.]|nr:hypothetical protein [Halioglobus sp.]